MEASSDEPPVCVSAPNTGVSYARLNNWSRLTLSGRKTHTHTSIQRDTPIRQKWGNHRNVALCRQPPLTVWPATLHCIVFFTLLSAQPKYTGTWFTEKRRGLASHGRRWGLWAAGQGFVQPGDSEVGPIDCTNRRRRAARTWERSMSSSKERQRARLTKESVTLLPCFYFVEVSSHRRARQAAGKIRWIPTEWTYKRWNSQLVISGIRVFLAPKSPAPLVKKNKRRPLVLNVRPRCMEIASRVTAMHFLIKLASIQSGWTSSEGNIWCNISSGRFPVVNISDLINAYIKLWAFACGGWICPMNGFINKRCHADSLPFYVIYVNWNGTISGWFFITTHPLNILTLEIVQRRRHWKPIWSLVGCEGTKMLSN